MPKIYSTLLLLVFTNLTGFTQSNEWKFITAKDYSIQYPLNWKFDQSGQMKTSFIIFSELTSGEDQFRENINLIIEDLTEHNLDLNKYVEISENQIKTQINKSKILLSERLKAHNKEYHKVIYKGKNSSLNLKFEQYIWVEGSNAYILTLTCEIDQFDTFQEIGEKILNSFIINT